MDDGAAPQAKRRNTRRNLTMLTDIFETSLRIACTHAGHAEGLQISVDLLHELSEAGSVVAEESGQSLSVFGPMSTFAAPGDTGRLSHMLINAV